MDKRRRAIGTGGVPTVLHVKLSFAACSRHMGEQKFISLTLILITRGNLPSSSAAIYRIW